VAGASGAGGASFEVDLDGLLLLVQHLQCISKDIFELGQGGPADVVGGMGQQSVQDALDGFRNAWRYGLGVIGDDMESARLLVQGAHDAYQNTETRLADAITGTQPSPQGQGEGAGK
jgi:hypothetical protein